MASPPPLPVRIGVSSCLLGERVRYDGGHKEVPFLVGQLGRHVEWVPVCPELEVGMGVPREPVRLVRAGGLRMLGVESGRDWTREMASFSRVRAARLARLSLSGYVLKSRSPSCGLDGVSVQGAAGKASRPGRGLFAAALLEALPLLPVEEEARLGRPELRECFLERVFAHHRWMLFRRVRFTARRLAEFHRRHECLLLARSESLTRRLGRIAARPRPAAEACDAYARTFFEALAIVPTRRSHAKVLRRIAKTFEDRLDANERREIEDAIAGYRAGRLPRLAPVGWLRRRAHGSLEDEYYLKPYPPELAPELRD